MISKCLQGTQTKRKRENTTCTNELLMYAYIIEGFFQHFTTVQCCKKSPRIHNKLTVFPPSSAVQCAQCLLPKRDVLPVIRIHTLNHSNRLASIQIISLLDVCYLSHSLFYKCARDRFTSNVLPFVAYDNVFRRPLSLPRRCSASAMFVHNHVSSFGELSRGSTYSFLERASSCDNEILSIVYNTVYCITILIYYGLSLIGAGRPTTCT